MTPTPSPRSSSIPGSFRHETRTVRCAPCVTSGSSPASLTTTASAHESSTSHRSTSKETRRSSPFLGSLTSILSCGSPVRRAFAAALAAAAAQVPVVQPVLSFSSFALAMLGGMGGSRSFRSGGIVRPAEHVGEVRAVQVRARTLSAEPRSDQDERLAREARLPDAIGELFEAALVRHLVRPARLVDDRTRSVGCVAALEQLLLQRARAGGGEEDRHRRPVRGETPYVLTLRHRGAAGPAGQDHRLGDLRHGQLPPDGRSRGAKRGDARYYLPLEPHLLAELNLFHHRAVDARIPGMDPGNLQILDHSPLVDPAHSFERDAAGLDDLRFWLRVHQYAFVDQAPGPDHDVRLADEPRAPEGQQIRRPRSRPDEPHLTQTHAPST